jgi:hypothetical protein
MPSCRHSKRYERDGATGLVRAQRIQFAAQPARFNIAASAAHALGIGPRDPSDASEELLNSSAFASPGVKPGRTDRSSATSPETSAVASELPEKKS